MTPSVGRIVHYVSRGSADGIFEPECRAAIITEVSPDTSRVSLCILNPQGIFFDHGLKHDDPSDEIRKLYDPQTIPYTPGTWHWPERVE